MRYTGSVQRIYLERTVTDLFANDFMLDRGRWKSLWRHRGQERRLNALQWRFIGHRGDFRPAPGDQWFITAPFRSRVYHFDPIKTYSGSVRCWMTSDTWFDSISVWHDGRMLLNRDLGVGRINAGPKDWIRLWWTIHMTGIYSTVEDCDQ